MSQKKIQLTFSDLLWFLVLALVLGFSAAIANAQSSCSTLRVQGAIANCSGASVLWSSSTPNVAGYYLQTYAGRFPAGNQLFPPSQRAFLIPSGCGTGGAVRVVEVLNSGGTCTLDFTGNLPHARPCSQCGTASSPPSAVNPAGGISSAPGAIISLYHEDFGVGTLVASSIPLPFNLAGLSVAVGGQSAQLFYVSPTQLNVLVPPFLGAGNASISVTRPDGGQMNTSMPLSDSLPILFTQSNGNAAVNIERRGGVTILTLWGTGFNITHTTGAATLRMNNRNYTAVYIGSSPGLVGVDQLNYVLPASETPSGLVGASVTMTRSDGRAWITNAINIQF